MSMKVHRHVIRLLLHVCAHLVEGRSRDEVALPVNLPSDGRVLRALGVIATCASGRTGVCGNICPEVGINNGTAHEVGVVVVLVIDDNKDLRLNTNCVDKILCVGSHSLSHSIVPIAEDTIIEWTLILIGSVAGTNG